MYINIIYNIYIAMNPQPKYYNESVKKAVTAYRERNRDKYNEYTAEYIRKRATDPEWAETRRQKMSEYNKIYHQKKLEKKIADGYVLKPRGRPRKVVVEEPLGEIEN